MNDILQLRVAYSRTEAKVHIQDLIRKDREAFMNQLNEQNGSVFICGGAKMGNQVKKLIEEIIGSEEYETMVKERRLVAELWS
jgi:sulfite reductase alpha subunit-like flavoprotein